MHWCERARCIFVAYVSQEKYSDWGIVTLVFSALVSLGTFIAMFGVSSHMLSYPLAGEDAKGFYPARFFKKIKTQLGSSLEEGKTVADVKQALLRRLVESDMNPLEGRADL